MAIESGFALAQILQHWSGDLSSALQFFQDMRKPRTDRITKTSYETGKLQEMSSFNPEIARDRFKWIMEYDLLEDVKRRLDNIYHEE